MKDKSDDNATIGFHLTILLYSTSAFLKIFTLLNLWFWLLLILAGIELKQIMTTGYPPLNEMTEGKLTILFFNQ